MLFLGSCNHSTTNPVPRQTVALIDSTLLSAPSPHLVVSCTTAIHQPPTWPPPASCPVSMTASQRRPRGGPALQVMFPNSFKRCKTTKGVRMPLKESISRGRGAVSLTAHKSAVLRPRLSTPESPPHIVSLLRIPNSSPHHGTKVVPDGRPSRSFIFFVFDGLSRRFWLKRECQYMFGRTATWLEMYSIICFVYLN